MISPERQRLADLEAEGKYVFHGSQDEMEILEPRQAFNYINDVAVKDGEPAVFASPSAEYATFMAVIHRKNFPLAYDSQVSTKRNPDGTFYCIFSATKETLDQLNEKMEGWVYVFNKSNFEPKKPSEHISYKSVTPIEKIKVTAKDLPETNILEKDK